MDSRTKKTNNKRFVRYSEGAEMYSMSVSKFMQLAKDAKACYKVNQLLLVNLDIIDEYLMDAARHVYELNGSSWEKGNIYSENFIIRYSPEEQGHLSLHYDQSRISCNVLLNEDFEGGGTYFSRHKALAQPKGVGYVTFHPGQITHKHGGMPVTKGTRYIIVSFINEDREREEHIKELEKFANENGFYND